MKLTKINYSSAVIFGVLSLFMWLITGLYLWSIRDILATVGTNITVVKTLIVTPITAGVVGYLFVLIGIVIYNIVARKYPIAWEVSKK
jgi:hypothetical protein